MSHSKNIYEKILKLPLFQGMSKSELTQVLTQTKFEFISLAKGKTIIYEGDNCTHLYFLLDGSICMITTPDDHRFNIIESIYAPDILQPEHFFGMTQRYDSTFTSHTDSQLLRIHKNDVNAIIEHFNIFRINLFNMLATQSQRQKHHLWRAIPTNTHQKIVRFFENHSRRPAGEKVFNIKMQQLANEIGESRLQVSRELNRLQNEQLIILTRGQIHIPALERLLM